MKIAQVAPLHESVPPKLYGGTERIVSYLTDALVDLGHDVTLFASGDSVTRARLCAACANALRLDARSVDPVADHVYLAECVFQQAANFDVVHSHIDYIGFPLWRRLETPHLTTLHGRLDIPNLRNLYREFSDEPLISISDAQRHPLSWANWQGTVYHGLPIDLHQFHPGPGKYLAFLGRFSPEKGADVAIDIARRSGIPLRLAAKVAKPDLDYFDSVIKPLLKQPGIEYLGEISETEKDKFLGDAIALLFPIDWPEPFGLVMIEALASGTPIIARCRGSVPEIIDHGLTGFHIETAEDGLKAVQALPKISRWRCRQEFEKRFTSRRMALDYLALYERHAQSTPASNLVAAL